MMGARSAAVSSKGATPATHLGEVAGRRSLEAEDQEGLGGSRRGVEDSSERSSLGAEVRIGFKSRHREVAKPPALSLRTAECIVSVARWSPPSCSCTTDERSSPAT